MTRQRSQVLLELPVKSCFLSLFHCLRCSRLTPCLEEVIDCFAYIHHRDAPPLIYTKKPTTQTPRRARSLFSRAYR